MTIKPIRWFKVPAGIPSAFSNPDPRSCVVCLNYKDYSNLESGVASWWLTPKVVGIPLISRWGTEDWWVALQQGAQQMVTYAACNDAIGFQDGDFYGVFQTHHEVGQRPTVLVGLAYANALSPLVSVQGMVEKSNPFEHEHDWLTPQFSIPFQIEVQLKGETPKGVHRVSRYKRIPVI